jgi:hypothetical protein
VKTATLKPAKITTFRLTYVILTAGKVTTVILTIMKPATVKITPVKHLVHYLGEYKDIG